MNITGKLILFITLFFNLFSQVNLKLLDLNGVILKQAGIGVPFVLKVEVEVGANDNIKPEIEGLDNPDINFKYEGTSSTITNIGGQVNVSRSFRYIVRIDKEGVYKFGPAKVYVQGGYLESDAVNIKVGEIPISKYAKSAVEANLNISTDKKDIYLGEKVKFSLELKAASDLNIIGISEPDFKDFRVSNFEGPSQETVFEKTQEFVIYKWSYTIYPKKSGSLIIPSINAALRIPEKKYSFFLSAFFNSKRENISSNSLVFNVKDIPGGTFDSVGKYSKFNINVDKNILDQGGAALLKLSVEGNGNLEDLDLDIKNLPDELRIYKSQSKIFDNTKEFEFVLQGISFGEYTIPSQVFKYFNPEKEDFETLKTKSLKIKINSLVTVNKQEKYSKIDEDGLNTIVEYKHSKKDCFVDHLLFLILLMMPVIGLLIVKIFKLIKSTRKYKLSKLRSELADLKNIYSVYLNLAAIKFNKKVSSITKQDLENLYQNKNWNLFLDKLIYFKFSSFDLNEDDFLDEAKKWFNLIEKTL